MSKQLNNLAAINDVYTPNMLNNAFQTEATLANASFNNVNNIFIERGAFYGATTSSLIE